MSSLGPDGTFVDEPAMRGRDVPTDVPAAPLWAAFRDRYTRAKERHGSHQTDKTHGTVEHPAQAGSALTTGVKVPGCL
jgi:hypothetical protein